MKREMCFECGVHSERCSEVRTLEEVQVQLETLRVAAFDFYAMVNGECPSLLEDNISAERLATVMNIELPRSGGQEGQ